MAKDSVGSVGLLSIHPTHVESILSGRKRVEFRRRSFPAHLTHAVVYATSPQRRVVAILVLDEAERGVPADLWVKHGSAGAISRLDFDQYFRRSEEGVALTIRSVRRIDPPVDLQDILPGARPPQSFRYLTGAALTAIRRLAGERLAFPAPG